MENYRIITACLFLALFACCKGRTTTDTVYLPEEDFKPAETHVLPRYAELNYLDSLECLCRAFVTVESEGVHNAIGDGGRAVGVLQIHPIMVDEANRFLPFNYYTYDDRKDSVMSCDMFRLVMMYKNEELDVDKACDIWNKKAGVIYRERVRDNFLYELEKLREL